MGFGRGVGGNAGLRGLEEEEEEGEGGYGNCGKGEPFEEDFDVPVHFPFSLIVKEIEWPGSLSAREERYYLNSKGKGARGKSFIYRESILHLFREMDHMYFWSAHTDFKWWQGFWPSFVHFFRVLCFAHNECPGCLVLGEQNFESCGNCKERLYLLQRKEVIQERDYFIKLAGTQTSPIGLVKLQRKLSHPLYNFSKIASSPPSTSKHTLPTGYKRLKYSPTKDDCILGMNRI